jgi:Fur family transcriptional regulator, ferric uptake regulator
MSPTSYQTAPPRGALVKITEPARKRNRGGRPSTIQFVEESALVEEVGHRLARAGLRWTAGRRAVVAIFESAQAPLSMQDLQDRATEARVPLSSLYRIVSDLVAANVLVRLEFEEGFARFELVEELAKHHHHLVCVECGTVEDFEGPGLSDLERAVDDAMRSIVRRQRFAVRNHRLDFFGTCSACTGT